MSKHDSTFDNALAAATAGLGIDLDDRQRRLCCEHFGQVCEANRRMNLTRISDPAEAAVRHYADSLAVLSWAQSSGLHVRTILDVGTGAGFPAVPLAIARPDWSITAIDGTGKKIRFLCDAAGRLALDNLECVHAHSSACVPGRRFELVVMRAASPLPKAISQVVRFIETGGWFAAYKTPRMRRTEMEAGRREAIRRGFRDQGSFAYELAIGGATLNRLLFLLQRI